MKHSASALLKEIDERFEPEIFLVGIRKNDDSQQLPACVEPEADFWIKSEEFNDVRAMAQERVGDYPENRLFMSHQRSQERHFEQLRLRSIKDAILQVIENHGSKPDELTYFSSFPVLLENYEVTTILGLQTKVIEDHTSLSSDYTPLHEYRNYFTPKSLLSAIINEFLLETCKELGSPHAGGRAPLNWPIANEKIFGHLLP